MRKHRLTRFVAFLIILAALAYLLLGVVGAILIARTGGGIEWSSGWRGWLILPILVASVLGATGLLAFGVALFFLARIETNLAAARRQRMGARRERPAPAPIAGEAELPAAAPTAPAGVADDWAPAPEAIAPAAAAEVAKAESQTPAEETAVPVLPAEAAAIAAEAPAVAAAIPIVATEVAHVEAETSDLELPELVPLRAEAGEEMPEPVSPEPVSFEPETASRAVAEPTAAIEVPESPPELPAIPAAPEVEDRTEAEAPEVVADEIKPAAPQPAVRLPTVEFETSDLWEAAPESGIAAVEAIAEVEGAPSDLEIAPPPLDVIAPEPGVQMPEMGGAAPAEEAPFEAESIQAELQPPEVVATPLGGVVSEIEPGVTEALESAGAAAAEIVPGTAAEVAATEVAEAMGGAGIAAAEEIAPEIELTEAEVVVPPVGVVAPGAGSEPPWIDAGGEAPSPASDAAEVLPEPSTPAPPQVEPPDELALLRSQIAALQTRLARMESPAPPTAGGPRSAAPAEAPAGAPAVADAEEPQVKSGIGTRLPGSEEAARIAAEMASQGRPRGRAPASPESSPAKGKAQLLSAGTSAPAPDNLEIITGIGAVYAQRLRERGVTTYAGLAEASYELLDQVTEGNLERVLREDWRGQARRLAQRKRERKQ